MAFDLDCDTCEFSCTVGTESAAYQRAKEHETDHPNHFVLIYGAE